MKVIIDKEEKDIIKGLDNSDLVMLFLSFIMAIQCGKEVIEIDSKKNS